MPQLEKGTTYSPINSVVTIDNLNAHVENAKLTSGAISEQLAIGGAASPASDQILLLNGGNLRKATVVQALGNVTPSELLNRNNNLSDLTNATTARNNLGLSNVENKSSSTIRSEITLANVTAALTYIPTSPTQLSTGLDSRIATSQQSSFATTAQIAALSTNALSTFISTSQLGAINGVAQLGADGKLVSNQVAALTTASQLALLGTTALPVIGAQALLPVPLPVTRGGTGTTTSTGEGAVVLQDFPEIFVATIKNSQIQFSTLSNVALGTPTSGNLSNCTNFPIGSAIGTLSVSNGGTGQTTYANGQLLIGNGTGLTKTTLTAGANVSITNGSGSITVASSVPAATSSQIGGIIPGSGFTVTSGVLDAVVPKCMASFDGQFENVTVVNSIYTKTGTALSVTYDFSGGKPQFIAENMLWLTFTANSGTAPTNGLYRINSISTSGTLQTINLTATGATNSTGAAVFRICKTNTLLNINSIIYAAATTEQGTYIVNLSKNFSDLFYIPVISNCGVNSTNQATPGKADAYSVLLDYLASVSGNSVARSVSSFAFNGWYSTVGDVGYASGILIYGNMP